MKIKSVGPSVNYEVQEMPLYDRLLLALLGRPSEQYSRDADNRRIESQRSTPEYGTVYDPETGFDINLSTEKGGRPITITSMFGDRRKTVLNPEAVAAMEATDKSDGITPEMRRKFDEANDKRFWELYRKGSFRRPKK